MERIAASQIDIGRLVSAFADTIAQHADELTSLDSAIGDGDHGTNMKRGFDAVADASAEFASIPFGDALKAVGMKLVMSIGGASGPLYGTLFISLGKQIASGSGYAEAFAAAVDAVAARGKSEAGQKTMLDVFVPLSNLLAENGECTITDVRNTADEALESTRNMEAKKGRAAFLGPRSVGHIDPGARSATLLVHAVCDVLEAAK